MITRAALRLDPPVPTYHRRRHHHNLAPRHQLTRPDPLRPRHYQPRPAFAIRTRPNRPPQRRHRHRHHRLTRTKGLHTADRGRRHDRVERHAEAPRRRSASDTGSCTGSLHPPHTRHAEVTRTNPPPPSLNVPTAGSPGSQPETAYLPGIARRGRSATRSAPLRLA